MKDATFREFYFSKGNPRLIFFFLNFFYMLENILDWYLYSAIHISV